MTDTSDPTSTCPPMDLRHAVSVFHREAFAALLAGEAPSIADLASVASRDAVGVAQAMTWLEARGALERDGNRLVGAHGLTRRPTSHTLTIGDRTLHTWCAFDAVAIPIALAASAQATTYCPTCARSLVVEVRDGEPPNDLALVLWLPGSECRNVISDFCAHANLFCTAEHLATWRSEAANPPGRTFQLSEVPALARVEWGDVAQTLR